EPAISMSRPERSAVEGSSLHIFRLVREEKPPRLHSRRPSGRFPLGFQGVGLNTPLFCSIVGAMTKSELIARLAARNPHLYQRDVERIVATVFDEISKALAGVHRVA